MMEEKIKYNGKIYKLVDSSPAANKIEYKGKIYKAVDDVSGDIIKKHLAALNKISSNLPWNYTDDFKRKMLKYIDLNSDAFKHHIMEGLQALYKAEGGKYYKDEWDKVFNNVINVVNRLL